MVGIKIKTDDIVNDARIFLELHAEERDTYSRHALATIHAKNDRKPELLPLTKDIQNLRSFLLAEINRVIDQLENREKEGQCHVSQRLLPERLKIIYSKGIKKERVSALFTTELNKAIFLSCETSR